jgi:hypothetical protein
MINYRELVGRAWSLQAGLPDPMSSSSAREEPDPLDPYLRRNRLEANFVRPGDIEGRRHRRRYTRDRNGDRCPADT